MTHLQCFVTLKKASAVNVLACKVITKLKYSKLDCDSCNRFAVHLMAGTYVVEIYKCDQSVLFSGCSCDKLSIASGLK